MIISNETVAELAKEMQPSKVARKLGMTTKEVRDIAKRAGVKLRNYAENRLGETDARSERMKMLEKLYCEERLTTKQVHERTGYNVVYLNQVANHFGWPQKENRKHSKERQALEVCKKVVAFKQSHKCGTRPAIEMLGIKRSVVNVNEWIRLLTNKGML
jgi:hypothetical protein